MWDNIYQLSQVHWACHQVSQYPLDIEFQFPFLFSPSPVSLACLWSPEKNLLEKKKTITHGSTKLLLHDSVHNNRRLSTCINTLCNLWCLCQNFSITLFGICLAAYWVFCRNLDRCIVSVFSDANQGWSFTEYCQDPQVFFIKIGHPLTISSPLFLPFRVLAARYKEIK